MGTLLINKVKIDLRVLSFNFAFILLVAQTTFNSRFVTAADGCGKRLYQRPTERIVGGHATRFADYPWLGALFRENKTVGGLYGFSCGGSLLNNQWVLTAAHCLYNYTAGEVFWRFGEYDLSQTNEPLPHEDIFVDKIFIHPDYVDEDYLQDIALSKLKTAIQYKDNIAPVCLPENNDNHVGERGIIAGWGASVDQGDSEDVLRAVEVPIISISDCEKWYKKAGYNYTFTEFNLCAGQESGGVDACEGDSGGPLMIHDTANDKYTVIGITSWGEDCAGASQPGVYEKVSAYSEWISQIMAANP